MGDVKRWYIWYDEGDGLRCEVEGDPTSESSADLIADEWITPADHAREVEALRKEVNDAYAKCSEGMAAAITERDAHRETIAKLERRISELEADTV